MKKPMFLDCSDKSLMTWLFVFLICPLQGCGGNPRNENQENPSSFGKEINIEKDILPENVLPIVIQQLKKAGWPEEVAAKVAEINRPLLEIQAEVNSKQFKETVRLLEKLGSSPAVLGTIRKWPETAGLLSGSDKPELVAKTIDFAGPDYNWVANFYMQHAERKEAEKLAQVLENNRPVICRLAKMGIMAPECLFMFSRQGDGAGVYERWLNDHLGSLSNTEEICMWVDLINRHGGKLLKKLNEDPAFRSGFERVYWPLFLKIVKAETVNPGNQKDPAEQACLIDANAMFFSDPNIWNLLKLESQAEKLIQNAGLMASKLLFGDPFLKILPYPEDLQNKVVELIVDYPEKSLLALCECRGLAPLDFDAILRKKVDTKSLANVLCEISKAGTGRAELIKKYSKMGEDGIRRVQAGQPEGIVTWIPLYYTLYKVPLDYYYGVEPTTMDLVQATADPLVMFFTLGGGKLIFTGTKEVGKKIAKEAAEKGIENFSVVTIREQGLKAAAKKVAAESVEQAIKKGWVSEQGVAYRGLQSMMVQTSNMLVVVLKGNLKFPALEITRPLQFAFKNAGIGRETWKRITGLEARLFMRGDARIYIRLNNTANAILGPRLGTVFNVAIQDLKLGAVVESEPGQKALEAGTKQIALAGKEAYGIWQRNASQWWLLNATEPLIPALAK